MSRVLQGLRSGSFCSGEIPFNTVGSRVIPATVRAMLLPHSPSPRRLKHSAQFLSPTPAPKTANPRVRPYSQASLRMGAGRQRPGGPGLLHKATAVEVATWRSGSSASQVVEGDKAEEVWDCLQLHDIPRGGMPFQTRNI